MKDNHTRKTFWTGMIAVFLILGTLFGLAAGKQYHEVISTIDTRLQNQYDLALAYRMYKLYPEQTSSLSFTYLGEPDEVIMEFGYDDEIWIKSMEPVPGTRELIEMIKNGENPDIAAMEPNSSLMVDVAYSAENEQGEVENLTKSFLLGKDLYGNYFFANGSEIAYLFNITSCYEPRNDEDPEMKLGFSPIHSGEWYVTASSQEEADQLAAYTSKFAYKGKSEGFAGKYRMKRIDPKAKLTTGKTAQITQYMYYDWSSERSALLTTILVEGGILILALALFGALWYRLTVRKKKAPVPAESETPEEEAKPFSEQFREFVEQVESLKNQHEGNGYLDDMYQELKRISETKTEEEQP